MDTVTLSNAAAIIRSRAAELREEHLLDSVTVDLHQTRVDRAQAPDRSIVVRTLCAQFYSWAVHNSIPYNWVTASRRLRFCASGVGWSLARNLDPNNVALVITSTGACSCEYQYGTPQDMRNPTTRQIVNLFLPGQVIEGIARLSADFAIEFS